MSQRLKSIFLAALFAVACGGYVMFAYWYSTAPTGNAAHIMRALNIVIPMGVAGLAAVVALVGLATPYRAKAITLLVSALTFLLICFALGRGAGVVRQAGFAALAERSAPLIAAIRQFHSDTGIPPDSLAGLVPRYLAEIPGTGMGAYPDYEYYVENDVDDRGIASWVLLVRTPMGGLNRDRFIYRPDGNYPDKYNYPIKGYGTSLERIGDWAYVHD